MVRSYGYLAHQKTPPPRTLQYMYAKGPMAVLSWGVGITSEVPKHRDGGAGTRSFQLDESEG